jgi:SulP family sulfate permease
MKRWLPQRMQGYQRDDFYRDLIASIVMTVLLVPQNLAYAMLAGLPPQVGLYAAMLPVLVYAFLGTSSTLSVGPVAVASLMTATSLAGLALPGSAHYTELAMVLALLTGGFLLLFGALRLGFLAHFLSRPVLSGFVSGSAIVIAVSQLKHLLGVETTGPNVLAQLYNLAFALPQSKVVTVLVSALCILVLWLGKNTLAQGLCRMGVNPRHADLMARLTPIAVIAGATLWASQGPWAAQHGVALVGQVPQGLPGWTQPWQSLSQVSDLWLSAMLIALVGFIQSVSVAQTMALRRHEKINPNRELTALGAANVASAFTGGYPVAGGLARTSISSAAGAQTRMAGALSVGVMAVIVLTLTPLFMKLPVAALSAIIVMAIGSMLDWRTFANAWRYDRADALALAFTFVGVLALGAQQGIVVGVTVSLGVLVWRSSRPHMAVLGRVPGTEHFRNVDRHSVQTLPGLLALRVDESLFFANVAALEERLMAEATSPQRPTVILLNCSAVNRIDSTALEALTELEATLAQQGVQLWLSEVKGPVTDRLNPTPLGQRLQQRVFLSTHHAFAAFEAGQHSH